jgi:hypothetical protein
MGPDDHRKTLTINGHMIWKIKSFCEVPYLQNENVGFGWPKHIDGFLKI